MILAALALSLLVPVVVTPAALLPLGAADSLPAAVGRRLGLSAGSTEDVAADLPARAAVRGDSTVLGSIVTLV